MRQSRLRPAPRGPALRPQGPAPVQPLHRQKQSKSSIYRPALAQPLCSGFYPSLLSGPRPRLRVGWNSPTVPGSAPPHFTSHLCLVQPKSAIPVGSGRAHTPRPGLHLPPRPLPGTPLSSLALPRLTAGPAPPSPALSSPPAAQPGRPQPSTLPGARSCSHGCDH